MNLLSYLQLHSEYEFQYHVAASVVVSISDPTTVVLNLLLLILYFNQFMYQRQEWINKDIRTLATTISNNVFIILGRIPPLLPDVTDVRSFSWWVQSWQRVARDRIAKIQISSGTSSSFLSRETNSSTNWIYWYRESIKENLVAITCIRRHRK